MYAPSASPCLAIVMSTYERLIPIGISSCVANLDSKNCPMFSNVEGRHELNGSSMARNT